MSDIADDDFSSLRPSLRRAIDMAFLKLAKQRGGETEAKQSARKKRRVGGSDDEDGGGFVVDDEDEDEYDDKGV